jgi:uncharacterized protein (TIGR02391 family)
MTKSLREMLPDPETCLSLEPEELAGFLLAWLNDVKASNPEQILSLPWLDMEAHKAEYAERLRLALAEAWGWLEGEQLLARHPKSLVAFVITRRGQGMVQPQDVDTYRGAKLLPKQLVHPLIAEQVCADFLRGNYGRAVWDAFKAIEVRVRAAGEYGQDAIGVNLMRQAFNPAGGPLTDRAQEAGEREAMRNLFTGAIGLVKNPNSHRDVKYEPTEAAQLIMFASYLLKAVDARTPPSAPT